MNQHYFSVEPDAPDRRRQVVVRLAGRDVTVETSSGVFSPGHVDLGTRVLLDHVDDPPPGTLLDLGCGWGPLALEAALRRPGLDVWAVDVNTRALALAADNARRLELDLHTADPDHVPEPLRFTTIWSNPPIRIGKPALHHLLTTWLGRLADDGTAWLVVARNLGADSLHHWLTDLGHPVERVTSRQGFRVLRAGPR
jgi:16S rRNA G1207 methylase RsmC